MSSTELPAGRIALDTAAFIYFIEEHPRYLPALEPLFESAASGGRELVTSAVTLLEVLVVPYRAGDLALANRYEALLTRSRGLRLVPLDNALLRSAAHLRARSHMRTPDALQVAAAVHARASVLVTNDQRVRGPAGLKIVTIEEMLRR